MWSNELAHAAICSTVVQSKLLLDMGSLTRQEDAPQNGHVFEPNGISQTDVCNLDVRQDSEQSIGQAGHQKCSETAYRRREAHESAALPGQNAANPSNTPRASP